MAHCRILTSLAEVEAIADAWRALQERVALAPFTDYDWAMVWWRAVAQEENGMILVAACYEDDRLVGLLPFCIRSKNGVRVLRLIGHEIYYYRNFLVEDDKYVPLIWQAVLDAKGYDFADIKNIHDGTREDGFLKEKAKMMKEARVYYSPHQALTPESYLEQCSAQFRRKLKNMRRSVEAEPQAHVTTSRGEPFPTSSLDFLIKRKKEWSVEKGKRGVFNEKNYHDLYFGMATLAASKGMLYVKSLEWHGEIVGSVLSFIYKGTIYGHTLAYAPKAAKFTPGILLVTEGILDAIKNGLDESNMMEGEEEYKQRVAKSCRVTHQYAYAATLVGKLFLLTYRALLYVRGLKEQARLRVKK